MTNSDNKTFQILPSRADLELLNRIIPVSRETLELMQCYVDLLAQWQKKTNLISNATLPEVWRRHICDSAQCFRLLENKTKWLDIGSGAGFPGIIIAILGRETENFKINLVESNQKKCAFLREVSYKTGLSGIKIQTDKHKNIVEIYPKRIESVAKQIGDVEVIVARAVTSLDCLMELGDGWLQAGAIGLFPKGRGYRQEITDCRRRHDFHLIEHKSQVEKDSVLLEISISK